MTISDEILAKIDIVDIVSRYVSLKKVGANYIGLCPFHSEKTPSFTVSQTKQIFKCFGCGAGGNAIRFYADIERIEYSDAVRYFVSDLGLYTGREDRNKRRQQEIIYQKKRSVLSDAKDFFMIQLQKNVDAFEYLTKKRFLSDDIILTFGIGYAPEDGRLLVDTLCQKGWTYDDIVSAGLVKQGHNQTMFRGRIMIPIADLQGNIVGFGGRVINSTDSPKYLNTPESSLYHKSRILYNAHLAKKHSKDYGIVVVEGYMDVIALARIGFFHAVATCGTALTQDHAIFLKKLGCPIFLLFDNDQAGQQALMRSLSVFFSQDIYPKTILLSPGSKDIDERVNLHRHDRDVGKKRIDFLTNATDSFMFQLQQYNYVDTPDRKNQIREDFFGILHTLKRASTQYEYLSMMADYTKIPFSLLQQDFVTFVKKKKHDYRYLQSSSRESPQFVDLLGGAISYVNQYFPHLFLTLKNIALCLGLPSDPNEVYHLWRENTVVDAKKEFFIMTFLRIFHMYIKNHPPASSVQKTLAEHIVTLRKYFDSSDY